jgi:beta-xylosidase
MADKPLFRDPIYDGAADPVVLWSEAEQRWFMFYTNRRANAQNTPGVSWVHGTKIGIAVSEDNGASWDYYRTADITYGAQENSYWAPDVIGHNGTYHMFLTYVPGIFTNWEATRDIVHLTSTDMIHWSDQSVLSLSSDRVIDASVFQLPDGTWRMWYNNERDRKSIYYAESEDLYTWVDKGKATGDQPGEGPKVFEWKGHYWMIVDVWDGLGVYRSDDCNTWTRQSTNLLVEPGTGEDDQVKGGHPDVVINQDRAYLFYFTHPGRRGEQERADGYEQRRSSIQVVELQYADGELSCDRDAPTYINLRP